MFEWFRSKKNLTKGEVVDLKVNYIRDSFVTGEPQNISYDILLHNTTEKIGECDLRIGHTEELYYAGNIGYRIYEPYRGHSYAFEACKVLFDLAKKKYNMEYVLITCSPDNLPSKRTCEKLEGKFLTTTPVPSTHWLYRRGETIKNIYRYDL